MSLTGNAVESPLFVDPTELWARKLKSLPFKHSHSKFIKLRVKIPDSTGAHSVRFYRNFNMYSSSFICT